MGWEQVFFQLKSVSCCPLGAALRDPTMCCGRGWLPVYPRVVMPQTFTPCSLGVSNSCCQNLGLQGRVPIEGHQVITRQEHRHTVASFDLKTPSAGFYVSHLVLAMQEFRLSVARLCTKPNSRFLCPVLVCTSQTTCLQLIEPCKQLASC